VLKNLSSRAPLQWPLFLIGISTNEKIQGENTHTTNKAKGKHIMKFFIEKKILENNF